MSYRPSKYTIVRLYWSIRFAGGPLRALRRWWALRSRPRTLAEIGYDRGGVMMICRRADETEAEYRARVEATFQ